MGSVPTEALGQLGHGELIHQIARDGGIARDRTFSDAIAAVRREIWHHQVFFMSRCRRDSIKIPRQLWDRAANALAYAA